MRIYTSSVAKWLKRTKTTRRCLLLGTDPKSVLCMYYKQGLCSKGAKCKFSHDLTIERKAEKRSLYDDLRDVENDENGLLKQQDK